MAEQSQPTLEEDDDTCKCGHSADEHFMDKTNDHLEMCSFEWCPCAEYELR